MNKLWFIFILGLSYPAFGQDYLDRSSSGYSSVVANIINKKDDKQYAHYLYTSINLSNSRTNVDLVFTDNLNTRTFFQIRLTKKQRQAFLEAIAEYKNLYNKKTKKTKKSKESFANANCLFIYWWKTDGNANFISYHVPFDCQIFTQDAKNRQFMLVFPSITDSRRRRATIQPPNIYINYEEVLNLEILLNEKTIAEAFKQVDQGS